jgi:hypothetical protein
MFIVPDVSGERVIIPRHFRQIIQKRTPRLIRKINFKERIDPLFAQPTSEEPKPIICPQYIKDSSLTTTGYRGAVKNNNIVNVTLSRGTPLSLVPEIILPGPFL